MAQGRFIAIGLWAATLCGCGFGDSDRDDQDAPSAGTLEFTSVGNGADESSGTASITLTRRGGTAGAVGVLVYIAGGTASPGSDYPFYIDYVESIQWPDGDASDKVLALPIFDDAILEGDETVTLVLASPAGGAALGTLSATVLTVVDSENALSGSLQFASAAFSVDESAGLATIVVTRSGGSVGPVTVEIYRVSGGTVMGGGDVPQWLDYVAQLSWPDGDASDRSFTVPIIDDAAAEPDEAVQFLLLFPTGGAAFGTPTDTVLTIIDDD